MIPRRALRHAVAFVVAFVAIVDAVHAQRPTRASMPQLHHVGLNSVDPAKAIDWYLKIWTAARRTEVAGFSGVEADMLLLFQKVGPTARRISAAGNFDRGARPKLSVGAVRS